MRSGGVFGSFLQVVFPVPDFGSGGCVVCMPLLRPKVRSLSTAWVLLELSWKVLASRIGTSAARSARAWLRVVWLRAFDL